MKGTRFITRVRKLKDIMGRPIKDEYGKEKVRVTQSAVQRTNRGGYVTIKWDKKDYDPIKGELKVTEYRPYRKGAIHGQRVYTKTVKPTFDANGNMVSLGRTVKGSSVLDENRSTVYTWNGDSRLENGFDALMTNLRVNGAVPTEKIADFYRRWNNLNNSQKRAFYDAYQSSSIVLEYGSDGINESKIQVEGDEGAYTELIDDLLNELTGEE